MTATFSYLFRTQHGIITRTQALAAGMTKDALSWRLRDGGPWQTLLPCVYATFSGPPGDVHRYQAALLHSGEGAALTGMVALRLLGICSRRSPVEIPVVVPHTRRRVRVDGVRLVRTRRMPMALTVDDLRVAEPVRSLADACQLATGLTEVRAVLHEAMRSPRVHVASLRAEIEAMGPRRSRIVTEALDEYGDGVRSVAEARAREKLLSLPIPRPQFNPDLYLDDGGFLARPDAYWPEAALAFEVDSWAYHGDAPGWERTNRRHSCVTSNGLSVLHASPRRIDDDWPTLSAEIIDAYHLGCTRPTPRVRVVPARA